MAHTLSELSLSQLEHAVELRRQMESLEKELGQLLGGGDNQTHTGRRGRSGPHPRAAAVRQSAKRGLKRKRRVSAAARAALSAAAKARWAKAKKAGRTKL
jgi:hypothetical protein